MTNVSKYKYTAELMDMALIDLLSKKDFEYITVKEICKKAGVNRSTFYLHYETIDDLLSECMEYMTGIFLSYFEGEKEKLKSAINKGDKDSLFLITPQYIMPYLNFIKENQTIFKVGFAHYDTLGFSKYFSSIKKEFIEPILNNYSINHKHKMYVFEFYFVGMMAVRGKWLAAGCTIPPEEITELITGLTKTPYEKADSTLQKTDL